MCSLKYESLGKQTCNIVKKKHYQRKTTVENEGSGSSQCHEGLSIFVHERNMISQGMQEV